MNLYYDLQNRKYEKLQAASEAVSQSRPCLTLPTPQDAAFFWGSPMLLPPFLAALRIHEALRPSAQRPSAFGVQSGPRLSEDVSRFLAFLFSRHASSPTLHRCLDTKCLGPCMPLERLGVWVSSSLFSLSPSMSEVGSCASKWLRQHGGEPRGPVPNAQKKLGPRSAEMDRSSASRWPRLSSEKSCLTTRIHSL